MFENFEGSSSGVEVIGAPKVFSCLEAARSVRCKNCIGDGDSTGFQKVLDSKLYDDDLQIEQLECVGHVKKRMGGGLS